MSEFVFDNMSHPYPVYYMENEEKKLYKTYMIDVGNEDIVRKLMDKKSKFLNLSKLDENDVEDFDEMLKVMKEATNDFFENDFDEIYNKIAKRNFVAMTKFILHFINFINEKV